MIHACVECKYFGGRDAEPYLGAVQPKDTPECKHPEAVTRDPIYGKALCHNERAGNKGCGKQGKLWVSKNTNA